jgi:benzoyl-CoA reductase/2-hydroxyglutaryl-CoA dehydratase subunit BcrC/BadD/HgdB
MIADMFVGETTCDGKKKAWEILAQDVPVHVIDIPQMKREKDIAAYEQEIMDFMKVVEDFTGNRVTPEALAESIKLINNKRKALQRIYNARKASPVPITEKIHSGDPDCFLR